MAENYDYQYESLSDRVTRIAGNCVVVFAGMILMACASVGIDGLLSRPGSSGQEKRQVIEYSIGKLDYDKGIDLARKLGYERALPKGMTEFEIRNNGNKKVLSVYVAVPCVPVVGMPPVSRQESQEVELSWTGIAELPIDGLEAKAVEK